MQKHDFQDHPRKETAKTVRSRFGLVQAALDKRGANFSSKAHKAAFALDPRLHGLAGSLDPDVGYDFHAARQDAVSCLINEYIPGFFQNPTDKQLAQRAAQGLLHQTFFLACALLERTPLLFWPSRPPFSGWFKLSAGACHTDGGFPELALP